MYPNLKKISDFVCNVNQPAKPGGKSMLHIRFIRIKLIFQGRMELECKNLCIFF